MGIKDFFSSSGRASSRLARNVKTVTNAYAQSADRYGAMESLLKDGSDEAYVGVLKRFTITSTKSIEDEEEKGWAYRQLSRIGKPLLPALTTFCLESESIAWALRILEDVSDESEEWALLDKLLEKHPPGYERDPSKKIQLLTHLQEIDDPKVAKTLAGYLADPDESVRYFAVEALIDIAEDSCHKPLIEHLLGDEDSLRLRTRILDGLADHGWDVSAYTDKLAKKTGADHVLQNGKIHKR